MHEGARGRAAGRAAGRAPDRRGRRGPPPGAPGPAAPGPAAGFVHTALVHSRLDELAAALAPFISEGLDRNERVHVNLRQAGIDAVSEALGPLSGEVHWRDTLRWLPHPGRRLAGVQDMLEDAARAQVGRCRFVGEWVPAGPSPLVEEWERLEAAQNEVLRDRPVTMVCVYDAATLPPAVVERASVTHPLLALRDEAWVTPPDSCSRASVPLDA